MMNQDNGNKHSHWGRGGRQGGRQGGRKGGREGREGGKEGGREKVKRASIFLAVHTYISPHY